MKVVIINSGTIGAEAPNSRRLKTLAAAAQHVTNNEDITIICSNNTCEYRVGEYDGMKLIQIPRIIRKSSKYAVIINFVFFFLFSIFCARKCDLLIATSGRLGTALLGATLKLIYAKKFYIDFRENFPRNASEIVWRGLYFPLVTLEKFCIKSADKINLISPNFLHDYNILYPDKNFSTITHAVKQFDNAEVGEPILKRFEQEVATFNLNKTNVIYAGNAGYGQLLHKVLPNLAQNTRDTHEYHLYVRGALCNKLRDVVTQMELKNVKIHREAPHKVIHLLYQKADVLLVCLGNYEFAKKVIPSKVFDCAASDTQILAGVSGECAEFLLNSLPGCSVFNPEDWQSAKKSLLQLNNKPVDRMNFRRSYSTEVVFSSLAADFGQVLKVSS